MKSLIAMLREADAALLPVLAQRWGVKGDNLQTDDLIEAVAEAMIDPARAEQVYDSLSDKERGVLQTLIGSGRKMNAMLFERMYGEIRKMGAGRIEREKPHQNPASPAEALYYRGLIAQGMDKIGGGIGPIFYIPEDLIAVLPTYKTGYNAAILEKETPALEADEDDEDEGDEVEVYVSPLEEVNEIRQADTSIVDDLTTLLAYLQIEGGTVDEAHTLDESERAAILHHLIIPDKNRLDFMLGVGLSADLMEVQNDKVYPKRAEVRRWLSEKRSEQLRLLVEAWRDSTIYRDLWHTPGLHPEPTGWSYDPSVGRQAFLGFLRMFVPSNNWWSLDEFIYAVKEDDPDFQRPGGDYDSWYIRSDRGDYLHGFESWDAVEGALLEFYLMGPMHWLGLVDLAEDAARLTAYGRAVVDGQTFPSPADPEEKIVIAADGTITASRKVQRFPRFQLCRFTTWVKPATRDGQPYVYRLDAAGIQHAAQQGINTEQIGVFIGRMLDNAPVPPAIAKLLENWRAGSTAAVTVEQVTVLRTTSPETLDFILDQPTLRRYLGARLGPMAVVARSDQLEALQAALGERGIEVEWIQ